jgi:Rrf2 family protein
MISQKARYAFKALTAFARLGQHRAVQIAELAASEHIPRKYLEQILLTLKAAGFLASRRGRGGGYELIKDPGQISLGTVLRLIDGPMAPLPCLSRTAYRRCQDCRSEETCAVRAGLAQAYQASLSALETTSIADAVLRAGADEGHGEPSQDNARATAE